MGVNSSRSHTAARVTGSSLLFYPKALFSTEEA